MKEFKAPEPIEVSAMSIFLAGSIEMGKAEDWQTTFTKAFESTNVLLYNPRRDDWDSSWKQTIEDPQFNEQVNWELDAMEQAGIIAVYIDPKTTSPITLLEIGLHAKSDKRMVVCCPEGFYRKGNVDIVCEKYNVLRVPDLPTLIATCKALLGLYD